MADAKHTTVQVFPSFILLIKVLYLKKNLKIKTYIQSFIIAITSKGEKKKLTLPYIQFCHHTETELV